MTGGRIVQLKAAQDAIEARAIAIPAAGPSPEWAVAELIKRLRGHFLYDVARDQWLRFDGAGWTATGEGRPDVYGEVNDKALTLLELIAARVNELHPPDPQKPAPGSRWQTVKVRRLIIEGARDLSALRVGSRDGERVWDREPHMLATPRGLVDLTTGKLREASPADMVKQRTRVAPDEGKPTRWLEFLSETFGNDAEVLTYVQCIAGYWLTGETKTHQFWCLVGAGGNGKSVFVDAIRYAMGDYATTSRPEVWCERKHDPHPEELARLDGKRLIAAAEPSAHSKVNDSRVKAWSGGDPVEVRFMRQDSFHMTPIGKLVFLGQTVPATHGVKDAWERRLRVVPFTRQPAEKDLQLPEKLKGEAGRILQWAIEGARLYYAQGLPPCRIVDVASDEHITDHDEFGSWLAECCEEAKGVETPAVRLCKSFNEWLEANGYAMREKPPAFNARLRRAGYVTVRGRQAGVKGLRLK
jgi:P4 family phage/plasmid primase-like protien